MRSEPIGLPPRSPNLNAWIERFVRSIKEECLSRMIFFGERSLHQAIREYVDHYHCERPHQGIGNVVIDGRGEPGSVGPVTCHERLGGLLRSYRRAA